MGNDNLLTKIKNEMSNFSKGQKSIAQYILDNLDISAYMTAAKLGKEVGISESTVVRFATELGFDGYPSFQQALREVIKNQLNSLQRISMGNSRISSDNVLKSVLQNDLSKIKKTIETIDEQEFNNVVEAVLSAKRIFILGVRSSSTLASFLGFYFNLMFNNVRLVHTTSVSEMFEQIISAKEGDLVIGISYPRYSSRTTKAMQYAKSTGCKVVAITDNENSPIAQIADYSLLASSDMVSFVDSLVAPLSVINALIVAVCLKKPDEVYATFTRLEKIWDEYGVYEKGE